MLASENVSKLKWQTMLEKGAEVSSFIQVDREVSSGDEVGTCHLEVYISGRVSYSPETNAFMVHGVWATARSGSEVDLYYDEYVQATANLIKAYFTEAGL